MGIWMVFQLFIVCESQLIFKIAYHRIRKYFVLLLVLSMWFTGNKWLICRLRPGLTFFIIIISTVLGDKKEYGYAKGMMYKPFVESYSNTSVSNTWRYVADMTILFNKLMNYLLFSYWSGISFFLLLKYNRYH